MRCEKMAIITYEHHGAIVFMDPSLKGRHREYCLCFRCKSFAPGTPQNCPKAQRLYTLCIEESMTTPVFECPVFVDSGVEGPCSLLPQTI